MIQVTSLFSQLLQHFGVRQKTLWVSSGSGSLPSE